VISLAERHDLLDNLCLNRVVVNKDFGDGLIFLQSILNQLTSLSFYEIVSQR
jgi:predicted nucleotide-binding protein